MKKIIAMLLAAALALALGASALAVTNLYATGDVNLRKGPSLNSEIITAVKKGATLTYDGNMCYDNRGVAWYEATYKGNTGWISSKYTSFSKSSSSKTTSGDLVYATGDTNVRTGPGLDYKELGVLKKGNALPSLDSVSYDDRGVAWYWVSYKGGTGWVSSKYTSFSGGSDYSGDYDDSYYGDRVYAFGDTNVRTGPGLDYAQKGLLKDGSSLEYLDSYSTDERGVDWYKVRYKNGTGWVSSKYTYID